MRVPEKMPDDALGYMGALLDLGAQIAPVLNRAGHTDGVRAVEHLVAAQPGVSEEVRITGLAAFGCVAVDIESPDPAESGAVAQTLRTERVANAVRCLQSQGLKL